jgi:hypothetical protein
MHLPYLPALSIFFSSTSLKISFFVFHNTHQHFTAGKPFTMLSLLTISLISLLLSFTTALPIIPTVPTLSAAESWHIPRLDMHMMSINTGIPGNPPWPDSARFNSSISFDVSIPDHVDITNPPVNITCTASWPNGTLPASSSECTDMPDNERMLFGLAPYTALGERRPELSFTLVLARGRQDGDDG